MRADKRTSLSAMGAAFLLACGGSLDCPNDLPAACPSPVPSYKSTIDPIIGARCRACHSAGGQESSIPFTTHDQVFAQRSAMLNQVYACKMPPAGSPGTGSGNLPAACAMSGVTGSSRSSGN